MVSRGEGPHTCQNACMTPSLLRILIAFVLTLSLATPCHAVAPQPATVFIEELTSPELRQRIAGGATTILVPIGATEQNGPHMVLGKHNVRVRVLAARIAQALGNAVVAPVVAYVPEGSIQPPVAHMRFAGTISIPEPVFESLLEGAARSFRQHGFQDVVFLGDHGGYQRSLTRVANRLNQEWAKDSRYRIHALPQYFAAAQAPFHAQLKTKGFTTAEIGTHAGLADTALALAVDPALVRLDRLTDSPKAARMDGVNGDPRRATAQAGQWGVQAIVDASTAAIREAIPTRTAR